MHLQPSFTNLVPVDALTCLWEDLTNWQTSDRRHTAQAACCVLCYATNFIHGEGKHFDLATAAAPQAGCSAEDCRNQLIQLLEPCCKPADGGTKKAAKEAAVAGLPWAKILQLILQLLPLILEEDKPKAA